MTSAAAQPKSGPAAPQVDVIPAARPLLGMAERQAVDDVLASGLLAQGAKVAAFEEAFADVVDGRRCIAVNSGTSALHLALLAAGIGPGDEVIVPSFTFAATANAVALTGATPVFVDIDLDTYCMSPAAARAAIGPATAAIMPVHLYGHPADLPSLLALAERYGLALFEDAAQAHAARIDGRAVGAWGLAAAFSFYPTKNMTTGEGGLVSTPDGDLERRVRLLRNQGQERRYENEIVGLNNRMTEIAAAIGLVQLRSLAEWTAQRQANAAALNQHLRGVQTPITAPGAVHVFHQYTIRVANRDAFAMRLAELGVGSGIYYPIPVHRLPAFGRVLDLPATEQAAREVLSLPVYPGLTPDELGRVIDAVNTVAEQSAAGHS
ncbi:MAG: DegT/DnrJ/EryC1/StrS family aminotransferase [Planctomycetia bacterium]|nr:DegT/DnrJ/EryC1/StrS family aminotransferase [Planctomycetia bacterium]